jgi:hypothetical protein
MKHRSLVGLCGAAHDPSVQGGVCGTMRVRLKARELPGQPNAPPLSWGTFAGMLGSLVL